MTLSERWATGFAQLRFIISELGAVVRASPVTAVAQQTLNLVAMALALWSVFYFTSPSSKSSRRSLSKVELLAIMHDIAKEFHSTFCDLALLMSNVMKSMKAKGLDKALLPEQLEGMLLQQGFQNRIRNAEKKVLDKHLCSQIDLEKATSKYSNDEEVMRYVDGIRQMYDDAVMGNLPLCIDIELNPELTEEKLFQIMEDINNKKQLSFQKIFQQLNSDDSCFSLSGAGIFPSPSLARRLQDANDDVEAEVIKMHESICKDAQTFQHALAVFSRNPEFMKKKNALDELNSEVLLTMMQQKYKKEIDSYWKKNKLDMSTYTQIEVVRKDQMQYRLDRAEVTGSLVCVLIVAKKNESAYLSEYTEAIDNIHLKVLDCSFLCIDAEEAVTSNISEVKKNGNNVLTDGAAYLTFLGKTLKFQSKNAKELQNFFLNFCSKNSKKNEKSNLPSKSIEFLDGEDAIQNSKNNETEQAESVRNSFTEKTKFDGMQFSGLEYNEDKQINNVKHEAECLFEAC